MSKNKKLFIEYAGLDKEAYHELWMECAREKLNSIMKPEKKSKKKNDTANGDLSPPEECADEEDPEMEMAEEDPDAEEA
jgi:hypothetical protein